MLDYWLVTSFSFIGRDLEPRQNAPVATIRGETLFNNSRKIFKHFPTGHFAPFALRRRRSALCRQSDETSQLTKWAYIYLALSESPFSWQQKPLEGCLSLMPVQVPFCSLHTPSENSLNSITIGIRSASNIRGRWNDDFQSITAETKSNGARLQSMSSSGRWRWK